jgi:hypothetical protein
MGQSLSVTKTSEDFDENGCLRGTFALRVHGLGKKHRGRRTLSGILEFDSREAEGIRFKVSIGDRYHRLINVGSPRSPQRIQVRIFCWLQLYLFYFFKIDLMVKTKSQKTGSRRILKSFLSRLLEARFMGGWKRGSGGGVPC